MNKITLTLLAALITSTSAFYAQCWKSIGRIDNDSVPTSFAIKEDGTLWAWGRNTAGLYGNGSKTSSDVPIQITKDTNWKSVFYWVGSVNAIKTDGTLWAWGYYLGDGTKNYSSIPKQIGTETQWKEVSAGYRTLALKNNGTLWYWDSDNYLTPTIVGTNTDWKTVYSNYAIKNNGTLWMIYPSYIGQKKEIIYEQVGNEKDFNQIDENYAIKTDGTLWYYYDPNCLYCSNFLNQKVQVSNQIWENISCGSSFNGHKGYGVTSDGALWSLNYGKVTRIGNETNWKEITVEHIGGDLNFGGTKIAIKTDGTIYTWGTECCGELGNGDIDSSIENPTILNTPGCKASLDELTSLENPLNVFPNPSTGLIELSVNDIHIEGVSIINTEGRTILEVTNPGKTIDISHFEKGAYFVVCSGSNSSWSKLIIKE
jgi:alpha-tubulin suppressor-like RCC1 family protein